VAEESRVIELHWNPAFTGATGAGVLELINMTVADKGTLGFASELSGEQARLFLDALNRKVADGDTQALYASYAGQPAFFVMMNLSGMPNCRHSAELAKAVVAPGFRGQGLPKHALRALICRARELGIEQFVLDVREGSRAHRLWTRYGFQTWGILPDYARVAGQVFAGHYMSQSIEVLAQRLGI
jgi:ribosomal protein S18 acetylase RimI-like enzyme